MEAIQIKYIKSCLGLNRCTPSYIVLQETNRDTIRIKTARRVLKFEEKIRSEYSSKLLKECLKERNGWSQNEREQLGDKGRDIKEMLMERGRGIQGIREAKQD